MLSEQELAEIQELFESADVTKADTLRGFALAARWGEIVGFVPGLLSHIAAQTEALAGERELCRITSDALTAACAEKKKLLAERNLAWAEAAGMRGALQEVLTADTQEHLWIYNLRVAAQAVLSGTAGKALVARLEAAEAFVAEVRRLKPDHFGYPLPSSHHFALDVCAALAALSDQEASQ